MADDIAVRGANQLAALTKRLKTAGDGGAKRDMQRGLRNAAKPLIEAAREGARETLPKKGGLAEKVAAEKFVIRTRTSGRNPGVRIVGVSRRHLKEIDQGRLRHPVWGHRDRWVTQQVTPGWWTDKLKEQAPQVRVNLLQVLHETARRIERG